MTACILMVLGALDISSAPAGETLARVRSAGVVRCGVTEELAGFSYRDASGRWQGLNADFCRAVAVAALGSGEKVTFIPLSSPGRFPALLSGKIDLLAHTVTMTFSREAGIGVRFAGVYFLDGQTFLVPRGSKVRTIKDLKGSTICVEKGTTSQVHLAETFKARGLKYTPLVRDSLKEATEDFLSGRCQAYTSDRSHLMAVLATAKDGPDRFRILSEYISKEPLGPVVRRGDEEWFTLIRWVLYALIEAEELKVTRANVRSLQKSAADPDLRRFLNTSGELGKPLGIKPDWVARIIAEVGNYGEIYERNFGSQSPLKIERGWNRLWKEGGLLYAPPFE